MTNDEKNVLLEIEKRLAYNDGVHALMTELLSNDFIKKIPDSYDVRMEIIKACNRLYDFKK